MLLEWVIALALGVAATGTVMVWDASDKAYERNARAVQFVLDRQPELDPLVAIEAVNDCMGIEEGEMMIKVINLKESQWKHCERQVIEISANVESR